MLNIDYKNIKNLKISNDLYQFIDQEVIAGLDIKTDDFFTSLSKVISKIQDENLQLLKIRLEIQQQIDNWHQNNPLNLSQYKQFLQKINYLLPEPDDFTIQINNVDDEIAKIAAPQLVVPVSNARFVLNAVNARWGSLYDALYRTNVIDGSDEMVRDNTYNQLRGNKVIEWVNNFLNQTLPLVNAHYGQIKSIQIIKNELVFNLINKTTTKLQNIEAFIGYSDCSFVFKNNNLHIEIIVDKNTAAIKDVVLESAVTTIIDFEDSVATVSSDEKIQGYRNFLGLMKHNLTTQFIKNGQTITRSINPNKYYQTLTGKKIILSGVSLMLVRNVGHHMFTNIVRTQNGNEIPEGILDAMVTGLIALHDIKNTQSNSKKGSIYIVKPKMHGAEEVAFSVKLFSQVEQALGLQENTIKIGIMDEERRTSVNLKACIKAAQHRVIFINTGFLDRTGDEIHTSMLAGAVVAKNNIKNAEWIKAYEELNVITGLECGFYKQAQIGKGMWAQPDQMLEMLNTKQNHLQMGANCAWVPSPTAATLHATHYHQLNIFEKQLELMKNPKKEMDKLLIIPLMENRPTTIEIKKELENNAHSILGYVVRWIDQGIGCSKVQDINNVGLMEDRATLRISSQHMANWLQHKICDKTQIEEVFKKMAIVVDKQNKNDKNYINMAPSYDGYAFRAALDLVYKALQQDNGYTEFILHQYRQKLLDKI